VGSTHDTGLYWFKQGVPHVQWRFDLLLCGVLFVKIITITLVKTN